jgi:hypothetical protein
MRHHYWVKHEELPLVLCACQKMWIMFSYMCHFLWTYTHSVRTSQKTQYVTTTKSTRLMLFRETVVVYYENHTEHINTLCGKSLKSCLMLKQDH